MKKNLLQLFDKLDLVLYFLKSEIEKHVKESNLNISEFRVLNHVYVYGSDTIQHLANKIHITSGSMTYLINNLHEKKLITRTISKSDRRITLIDLSAKGKKVVEELKPEYTKAITNIFSSLSPEEVQTIDEVIDKIIEEQS